jgi:hypothetical protein
MNPRALRLIRSQSLLATCMILSMSAGLITANAQESLPSWNEGPAKKAILEFVAAVTDKSGKDFVKPAERIAVFDNDGTLWVEQPMYTQLAFASSPGGLGSSPHQAI